jgi:hypothetical protein
MIVRKLKIVKNKIINKMAKLEVIVYYGVYLENEENKCYLMFIEKLYEFKNKNFDFLRDL